MRSIDHAIWAPFQSPDEEATGRTGAATSPALAGLIGRRYEVQHLLGKGGMGAVYLARDRLTGQLVALKRVALEKATADPLRAASTATEQAHGVGVDRGSAISGSRTLRVALAQEFRTLASLRHPNIVSVLDYGFDHEHLPFFTMEYLEEPRDLLDASLALPLLGTLDLVTQLLRALTYLHRHAILHRDLKPSNILVVQEQGALRLKVLDFGIAVKTGSAADMAGTAAYMAPEAHRGEPPTPAADLYAVGQLLYQMLTQKPGSEQPGSASELTLVAQVEQPGSGTPVTEPQSPLTLVPPGLPNAQRIEGALAAIVAQLIDPDPQSRYRDAAAVLNDLSKVFCELGALPLSQEPAAVRDSFLQAAGFVGRERELGQLATALVAASRGAGAVILVGGESGVGKSRLLEELRTSALVRGVRTIRGQAVSDGGSAYQVFSDVLPQLLLDVALSDQAAAVLKELVSELPTLLGHPIPDAAEVSPQAAQQRLHQTLLATMTSCPEPVLLLLEDLHWAAAESLELLKELAARTRQLPLLIVASYRDDERADLPQLLPAATTIKLPRLASSGIAALSHAMLGEPGTQPQLLAFLEKETEGNVSITHLDSSVAML